MDRPAMLLALLCLSGLVDTSMSHWFDVVEDDYDIDYEHYDAQESTTSETTIPEDDEDVSNVLPAVDIVGGGPTTDYLTYILSATATTEDEHSTTYNYEHQTSTDRLESTKPNGTSLIYNVVNLLTQNYSQTIDNLTSEIRKQQVQITELVKSNTRLQEKVDYIEQQTKTNSLIFFNVPESDRESYKTTLNKVLYVLNKVMKLQTRAEDIAVAMRSDSEEFATYRPIVVRFTNFATKMQVLAARSRLQRSQVVIEADYSEGVAKIRAELVPYMNAARARGLRAFLLYDRLVVNGVKRTLQELQAGSKK